MPGGSPRPGRKLLALQERPGTRSASPLPPGSVFRVPASVAWGQEGFASTLRGFQLRVYKE